MKILKVLICFILITISCRQAENTNSKIGDKSLIQNNTPKWVDLMIEGYEKFNIEKSITAADQIYEATELMPKKNLENYLVSAMVYAGQGEKEKAYMAIEKAIDEGFKDPQLLNSINEYLPLHNDIRWSTLIAQAKELQDDYENSIQNPNLLEELKTMWIKDQEALALYEENTSTLDGTSTARDYERLFKPVENRWEINKNKLDSIIDLYGWPGNQLVGEEGAKIAWGIPQHHPNIFFKRKCLKLIKKAVERGDVDPDHYAKLKDRIARETWQKQTYGSSMRDNAPYPINNPSTVNKRRSELGLFEPIEVYAIYHGFRYKTPTSDEIQSTYRLAQEHYGKFEDFVQLKELDSACFYIKKSISYHGDLSNHQLYNASKLLVQFDYQPAESISLTILKVLIWRKWDERFEILKQDEFTFLQNEDEWIEIQNLLKLSR